MTQVYLELIYFHPNKIMPPSNFLFRVGNGEHLISSSKQSMWGINSDLSGSKMFISNAKPGDLIWFVKNKTNGQLIAVATFVRTEKRNLGPLIAVSLTNEELGWTKTKGEWDTEIHFKNLYNITSCNLISEIKGNAVIRRYNENCKIDLPVVYNLIVRYSGITTSM